MKWPTKNNWEPHHLLHTLKLLWVAKLKGGKYDFKIRSYDLNLSDARAEDKVKAMLGGGGGGARHDRQKMLPRHVCCVIRCKWCHKVSIRRESKYFSNSIMMHSSVLHAGDSQQLFFNLNAFQSWTIIQSSQNGQLHSANCNPKYFQSTILPISVLDITRFSVLQLIKYVFAFTKQAEIGKRKLGEDQEYCIWDA